MTKFISEECYNDIMEMAAEIIAEAILGEITEGENLRNTVRNVQKMAYDELQKERSVRDPKLKVLKKLIKAKNAYAERTGVEDDTYLGDNLERAAMKTKDSEDK